MHLPLREREEEGEKEGEGEREARGYRVEKEGERAGAKRDNFKRKMSVQD